MQRTGFSTRCGQSRWATDSRQSARFPRGAAAGALFLVVASICNLAGCTSGRAHESGLHTDDPWQTESSASDAEIVADDAGSGPATDGLAACDVRARATPAETTRVFRPGIEADVDVPAVGAPVEGADRIVGGTGDTSANPASMRRRDATVVITLEGGGMCSGTLITPRLVLTAAHCATPNTVADPPMRPATVFFGSPLTVPGVPAVGCFRHDDYGDGQFGGNVSGPPGTPSYAACGTDPSSPATRHAVRDIAVVALPERLEFGRAGTIPVTPARLSFQHIAPGTTTRLVGWGGIDDAGTLPSTRQAVERPLWDYGDGITRPSNPELQFCPTPGVMETAIGFNLYAWDAMLYKPHVTRGGDSGGSALIGNPDLGPMSTVGVISGGENMNTWVACSFPPFALEMNIVNSSFVAPVGDSDNAAWLRQFLDAPVRNPSDGWPGAVYLGDWDLPAPGDPLRAMADPALLAQDMDGDGLITAHDNCPTIRNPEQRDSDLDGIADFVDCGLIQVLGAVL